MMQKAIFILTVAAMMSCGKVPETHYYTLDHFVAEGEYKSLGTLLVQGFQAEAPYGQEQFVYRPNEYEIRFDHYRRWIQTPGQLLSLRLVEYLRSTGAFEYVGLKNANGVDSARRLRCNLLQFEETVDGGQRYFNIRIYYQLSNAENALAKTGYLNTSRPITGTASEDIVRAANQAASELFSKLFQVLLE